MAVSIFDAFEVAGGGAHEGGELADTEEAVFAAHSDLPEGPAFVTESEGVVAIGSDPHDSFLGILHPRLHGARLKFNDIVTVDGIGSLGVIGLSLVIDLCPYGCQALSHIFGHTVGGEEVIGCVHHLESMLFKQAVCIMAHTLTRIGEVVKQPCVVFEKCWQEGDGRVRFDRLNTIVGEHRKIMFRTTHICGEVAFPLKYGPKYERIGHAHSINSVYLPCDTREIAQPGERHARLGCEDFDGISRVILFHSLRLIGR